MGECPPLRLLVHIIHSKLCHKISIISYTAEELVFMTSIHLHKGIVQSITIVVFSQRRIIAVT